VDCRNWQQKYKMGKAQKKKSEIIVDCRGPGLLGPGTQRLTSMQPPKKWVVLRSGGSGPLPLPLDGAKKRASEVHKWIL